MPLPPAPRRDRRPLRRDPRARAQVPEERPRRGGAVADVVKRLAMPIRRSPSLSLTMRDDRHFLPGLREGGSSPHRRRGRPRLRPERWPRRLAWRGPRSMALPGCDLRRRRGEPVPLRQRPRRSAIAGAWCHPRRYCDTCPVTAPRVSCSSSSIARGRRQRHPARPKPLPRPALVRADRRGHSRGYRCRFADDSPPCAATVRLSVRQTARAGSYDCEPRPRGLNARPVDGPQQALPLTCAAADAAPPSAAARRPRRHSARRAPRSRHYIPPDARRPRHVDQHPHTKVSTKRMKRQMDEAASPQALLIRLWSNSTRDAPASDRTCDDLALVRLVVEGFGPGAAWCAKPRHLGEVDAEALVRDIAEISPNGTRCAAGERIAGVAATMACTPRSGRAAASPADERLLREWRQPASAVQSQAGRLVACRSPMSSACSPALKSIIPPSGDLLADKDEGNET